MGSVQERITTFKSVDDHPHVRRHQRQRIELERRLQGGVEKVAALQAERKQLRRAQHQAEVVSQLAGGGLSVPAAADRVAAIDAEISAAAAFVEAARDALQMHHTIAQGVRSQLQREADEQAAAAARDLYSRMALIAMQFAALNDELADLLGRSPSFGLLPFPYPSTGFAHWASQLARLEGQR